jgi:hypothetical protein
MKFAKNAMRKANGRGKRLIRRHKNLLIGKNGGAKRAPL